MIGVVQWEKSPFQYLAPEWLTFVATARGNVTGWGFKLEAPAGRHIHPGKIMWKQIPHYKSIQPDEKWDKHGD